VTERSVTVTSSLTGAKLPARNGFGLGRRTGGSPAVAAVGVLVTVTGGSSNP
jgi:hypothetical protein